MNAIQRQSVFFVLGGVMAVATGIAIAAIGCRAPDAIRPRAWVGQGDYDMDGSVSGPGPHSEYWSGGGSGSAYGVGLELEYLPEKSRLRPAYSVTVVHEGSQPDAALGLPGGSPSGVAQDIPTSANPQTPDGEAFHEALRADLVALNEHTASVTAGLQDVLVRLQSLEEYHAEHSESGSVPVGAMGVTGLGTMALMFLSNYLGVTDKLPKRRRSA